MPDHINYDNPASANHSLPLSPYDLQLLINARKTLLDKASNARKDILKRIYEAAANVITGGIASEGGFKLIDSPGGTTWERISKGELEAMQNITPETVLATKIAENCA